MFHSQRSQVAAVDDKVSSAPSTVRACEIREEAVMVVRMGVGVVGVETDCSPIDEQSTKQPAPE